MNDVRLDTYDNAWYKPGRGRSWQAAWFFLGSPLLRWSLLPSSSLRVRVLRWFGAQVGSGVVIKPGVQIKYPWHLYIGDHTWIGENAWIDNLTTVRLGSHVCVSQGAYFCTGNHDWSDPAFALSVSPIRLEDGAWVGARCMLLPGVVIGRGGVAAAGSTVCRDIPDYEIHSGSPAVFARRRVIRSPNSMRVEAAR